MLIEIGKDIVESAKRKEETALRTLNYLGMAYRNKKHIVYAEQPLLSEVINIKELLPETRNVFLYIQGKLTTVIFPLRDFLKFRTKLMLTGRSERLPDLLLMNLNDFKEFELYEEAHLLSENIFDCKFYKQIGIHYLNNNNINEVSINLFPLQGGGATSCKVYREEAEMKQHYCLAILDSDKGFPGCKKKKDTTYDKVDKVDESLHPINCKCACLKYTREIENMIPSVYLKRKYHDKDLIKANVDLSYIDLKSGLLPKLLWYNEAITYYKKLFSNVPAVLAEINRFEVLRTTKNNREVYCKDVKDQIIINGLGDKTLELFLDDNPDDSISKMLPDNNNQHRDWELIGRLIVQWCCAPIIVSTI